MRIQISCRQSTPISQNPPKRKSKRKSRAPQILAIADVSPVHTPTSIRLQTICTQHPQIPKPAQKRSTKSLETQNHKNKETQSTPNINQNTEKLHTTSTNSQNLPGTKQKITRNQKPKQSATAFGDVVPISPLLAPQHQTEYKEKLHTKPRKNYRPPRSRGGDDDLSPAC